jgi:hypothetical protein
MSHDFTSLRTMIPTEATFARPDFWPIYHVSVRWVQHPSQGLLCFLPDLESLPGSAFISLLQNEENRLCSSNFCVDFQASKWQTTFLAASCTTPRLHYCKRFGTKAWIWPQNLKPRISNKEKDLSKYFICSCYRKGASLRLHKIRHDVGFEPSQRREASLVLWNH